MAIYTYDELRAFAENDTTLNGIIINPNSATMPIWKKDMELLEKTSKEEKKIYMPDTKSSSESKNEENENEPKELITCKKCGAKYPKSKIDCNGLCPICVYKDKKNTKLNTSKNNDVSSDSKSNTGLFGKIKKLFK